MKFALAIALLTLTPVLAQEPKPKPTFAPSDNVTATKSVLTAEDEKVLTAAVDLREKLSLTLENLQLKATLTAQELQKATTALDQLVTAKTPAGMQLNRKADGKFELVEKPK